MTTINILLFIVQTYTKARLVIELLHLACVTATVLSLYIRCVD